MCPLQAFREAEASAERAVDSVASDPRCRRPVWAASPSPGDYCGTGTTSPSSNSGSDVKAGGGAVTISRSNGATVLGQLGVDMDGAGQLLSTLRVVTSTGRPVATVDLTAIVDRLGAPVRMVPRRVPLERPLEGFPTDRIWRNARAVGVVSNGLRLDFEERIAKLQQLLAASTLGARR